MNNTYKVVWNASLGAWNVASEIAGSRGKTKSSKAARAYVLASIVGVSALAGALDTANAAVQQTLDKYYYSFMGNNPVFLNHQENIAYMGQMAYGNSAKVAKEYGITFGGWSESLGTSSSAFGHEAKALADYSTALGHKSTASAESSVAVGSLSEAYGLYGVAIGKSSSVSLAGARGVAMGTAAKVTGSDGISIGTDTEANQVGSIALGYKAKANHVNSVAIGKDSVTTADNTVSFGKTGGTRLRLTNIAAGVDITDAVTLGQMNVKFDGVAGKDGVNANVASVASALNMTQNPTTLKYNEPAYKVGKTAAGNSVQSALDTVNSMVFGDSTNPTAPSISNNMTVLANALNVGGDQTGGFTAPEYTVNNKKATTVKAGFALVDEAINGVNGQNGLSANVASVADAVNMKKNAAGGYDQPAYKVGTTAAGNSVQSALDTVNSMVFGDSTNPTAPSISNNMTVLANALNVGVDQTGGFTAPEYTVNNKKATTVKAGFALVDEAINGVNGQNGLSANVASVADALNMKKNAAGGYDQPVYTIGGEAAGSTVQAALNKVNDKLGTINPNAVSYDNDTKAIITLGGTNKPATIRNVKDGVELSDAVNMAQYTALKTVVDANQNPVTNDINLKYLKVNGGGATEAIASTKGVAIGGNARAASDSTAVGFNANAVSGSVALGSGSIASAPRTVSVGTATAKRKITNLDNGSASSDAVTFGQTMDLIAQVSSTTRSFTEKLVSEVSNEVAAVSEQLVAKSFATRAFTPFAVELGGLFDGNNLDGGNNAIAQGNNAIALGSSSVASGKSALALGSESEAQSEDAVALGAHAVASASGGLAVGSWSTASNTDALAIGTIADASGQNGIAFGRDSGATKESAVAIGASAKAQGLSSIAIGALTESNFANTIAIGTNSKALADNAVAIGSYTRATGIKSSSLGAHASATADGSVALGSDSIASTVNSISVGKAESAPGKGDQFLRSIENVKDGVNLTDVATIGQLKAVDEKTKLAENAVQYDPTSNKTKITLSGTTISNLKASALTELGTEAVTTAQLWKLDKAISDINGAIAPSDPNAPTLYKSVQYTDQNRTEVKLAGSGAKITNLLAGAVDNDAVNFKQLSDVKAIADAAKNGLNGADGKSGITAEVTKIAAALNMASNGSGGFTAPEYKVNNQSANNVQSALNLLDTKINNYTPTNAVQYKDGTKTEINLAGSGAKITNLLDGTAAKDAVNKGQLEVVRDLAQKATDGLAGTNGKPGLNTVSTSVAAVASALNMNGTEAGGFTAPSYNVNNQSATNVQSALGLLNDRITSTAGNAVQYTNDSKNRIELGSGSTTATITNLADGVGNSDAVNKKQLNAVELLAKNAADGLAGTNGKPGLNTVSTSVAAVASALNMNGTEAGGFTAPNYNVNSQSVNNVQSALNILDAKITSASGDGVQYAAGSNKGTIQLAGVGGTTITNLKDSTLAPNGNGAVTTGQLYTTNTNVGALDTRTTTIEGNITNISNGTIGLVKQANSSSTITVASDKGGLEVNFSGNGQKRKLTGIEDSIISAGGSNAVTTGQLSSTNSDVSAVGKRVDTLEGVIGIGGGTGGPSIGDLARNSVQYDNATTKDKITLGKAGTQTTITNLKAGVADFDAVNMAQYNLLASTVGNVQTSNGDINLKYMKVSGNSAQDASAGSKGVAIGGNARASSDSVSIGFNANAVSGSVALGSGSIANAPRTVSVGAVGAKRKITNVDNGTADSDAATFGQLISRIASSTASTRSYADDLITQVQARTFATTATDNLGGLFAAGEFGNSGTATATGYGSLALGNNAKASGLRGVAIGNNVEALGENSTVIGSFANASGNYSIAMGYLANAGQFSVATGYEAKALGNDSTAIGSFANASGYNTIAIGYAANASGYQSIAMNYAANASGHNSIAMGNYADASKSYTVAMGHYAKAQGAGSIAIGSQSVARGYDSVALGSYSVADRNNAVSIGNENLKRQIINVAAGTQATDAVNLAQLNAISSALSSQITASTQTVASRALAAPFAVELGGLFDGNNLDGGNNAIAQGNNAIALGSSSVASGKSALALGNESEAQSEDAVALGAHAVASASGGLAVGSWSTASNTDALAIGTMANASGQNGIAFGRDSGATKESSVAIGAAAKAQGLSSIAIGALTESNFDNTIAIGTNSKALADNAVAIGSFTRATGIKSASLGNGAQANADNSVALGANSVATTINSISVGKAESAPGKNDQILRTIENVKDGANATDVATYGQLKEVKDSVASGGALGVGYTDDKFGTVVLKGSSVGGTTISGLKNGTGDSDAVNNAQLKEVLAVANEARDGLNGSATKAGLSVVSGSVDAVAVALSMTGDSLTGWKAPSYIVDGKTVTTVEAALRALDDKTGASAGTNDANVTKIATALGMTGTTAGGLDDPIYTVAGLNGGADAKPTTIQGAISAIDSNIASVNANVKAVVDGINGTPGKAGISTNVEAIAVALNMNGDAVTGWTAPEYEVNGGKFANVQLALSELDSKTGASATTNDANVTKIATALGMTGTVAGGLDDPIYTVAGLNGGAEAKPTTIQGAISAIDSNIASVNANVKAAVDGINGTPGKAGISENVATIAAALNMGGDAVTGWTAPKYTVDGVDFTDVGAALTKLDNKVGTGGGSDNLGGLFAGNNLDGGNDAIAQGSNAIALGSATIASGKSALALGNAAEAQSEDAVALGSNSVASAAGGLAIGSWSTASNTDALAIGTMANASGQNGIAFGRDSGATKESSVAIGAAAKAQGLSSIAIGALTESNFANTIAIGTNSKALADNATAIGYNAKAIGLKSSSLGAGAQANADNSVALGSDSIATSVNSISVGRAESAPGKNDQILRTIENVANGTKATDVATYGQLKEVADSVITGGTLGVAYDTTAFERVNLKGTNGSTITNLKAGVNATDAVNKAQLDDVAASVAAGGELSVGYTDKTFGTVALKGGAAGTTITNLKAGVNATDAVNKTQLDIVSSLAQSAKDGLDGTPGKAGISENVATIATALNMKGDAATGWKAPSYTVQGKTVNNVQAGFDSMADSIAAGGELSVGYTDKTFGTVALTGAAGTTITNLKAGVNATDAVNKTQLDVVSSLAQSAKDGLNGINGKPGITANVGAIAVALNMKGDAVDGWTAPEYTVATKKANTVQDALNLLNTKIDQLPLDGDGGSSIDYDDDTYASITFAGKPNGTVLKNVAAGIEDKDATNVSQLKVIAEALGGGVDDQGVVTTKTYNVSGRDNLNLATAMDVLLKDAAIVDAVVYDRANNRVMLNAQDSFGRAVTGGTLVTNVANGAINATSLDATNGSQMFEIQTQVTNITNVINGTDPKGFIQQSADKTLTIGKDVAGTALNISGISGDRTISGVKEGVLDNDAATVGQVKKIVGSAGGSIAANGKDGKPGKDAVASGNGSTSIGKDSIASGDNSVAIGNGSIADRPNTLSVGSEGNERIISNVAPGVLGTDAVNLNQLNNGLNTLDQKLSKDIQAVRRDVVENRKAASGGIASAMAMSTLPQAYTPGSSLASASVGGYGDRSALAIGISNISKDGKWIFNAKGSANTAGKVGGAIGIGYQW